MGKHLIIAEKPSVGRDIASALKGFTKNGEYLESPTAIISHAIGHLVGLDVPESKNKGNTLDSLPIIPPTFGLAPLEKTKSQLFALRDLMRRDDVDTIVNACDAGREGELIFRLIYEWAACKKPMKRMWLQSMTPAAITEAFNKMEPGAKRDDLAAAARSRAEADWLLGINGTRGISSLHERLNNRYEQMNTGRVQTPTLAILVDREAEIINFKPQDYWEVHGTFKSEDGTYTSKWVNPGAPADDADKGEKSDEEGDGEPSAGFRVNDKDLAAKIVAKCKSKTPTSVADQQKITQSLPPKLFDLTTLQREANKAFKFSAKKTLDIAQSLYEKHKAISYPRTDSSALPEDYVSKSASIMGDLKVRPAFAPHADKVLTNSWIQPTKRIFDNSKISDHFAIIPTGSNPVSLTPDEEKLYDMVVRRFMAVFFPAAEYSNTTRITIVEGETFKITGKVLVKQGWLEVYGTKSAGGKGSLCVVKPGETVQNTAMASKAFTTKPPKRLTEAMLLSAMEGAGKLVEDEDLRDIMKEKGLGTPATRAATIEGLLYDKTAKGLPKVPYVVREGKEQHLVPTNKGTELVNFLRANGGEVLTSPKTTGEWESRLSKMEKGGYAREQFMTEIGDMTRSIIKSLQQRLAEAGPAAHLDMTPIDAPCPKCQASLVVGHRTINCAKACGFVLWRTVSSRALSMDEIKQILSGDPTAELEGFISKEKQKAFKAALRLKKSEKGEVDGKLEFVFQESRTPRAPIGPAIAAKCPKCKDDVGLRPGEHPMYACTKCDFRIFAIIAKRELSSDEATTLIKTKKVGPLKGFISSRTEKEFEAGLKLVQDKESGRFKTEFVFEKREKD